MGDNGNAIFLIERGDEGEILHAFAGIVGQNGLKEKTWYTLTNGVAVEV